MMNQLLALREFATDYFNLDKIGVELEVLSPDQADYIGVKVDGPFKPEYYRY